MLCLFQQLFLVTLLPLCLLMYAWKAHSNSLALPLQAKRTKTEVDKLNQRCKTCGSLALKFVQGNLSTPSLLSATLSVHIEVERLSQQIEYAGQSKGWTKDNEKFRGRYDMREALLAAALENVCSRSDQKLVDIHLPTIRPHDIGHVVV